MRAARDEDGNYYTVPSDMTYREWEKQAVNSPIKVDQTVKITKKDNNNSYSVNRDLVNSKKYHDKFEHLTEHKSANESAYQEAMKMLEHRDGTGYEDIVALDAKTGSIVVKNTSSFMDGKTGFTKEQYDEYLSYDGDIILLHNHPNSSRQSFADISTIFNNDKVAISIAVGHDGSVNIITNPDRKYDVDTLWNELYNKYKQEYKNSSVAKIYALDDIYEMKIFNYDCR